MSNSMTSSKPYMLRALYEWIVDNDCTPHIVVDAHREGVMVPQQYVNKNGEIVLNIAPGAVQHLSLENDACSFSARFSGVSHDIFVPSSALLGIYARENGRGMMFDAEVEPEPEPPKPAKPVPSPAKKPGLRLVK
ncbi:ClpXP protease specificity-enhancing factor [Agaribacterium haliotis]|uniref:ClpXP protease specificity-enhancing factor n=1 Tax=Agaribacterium haliotis TaxID=2013869 RepID=UPI001EFEB157|nr:ClpXP protease specificity-enhancing factor [Agaribacterium haliotis]